MKRVRRTDRRSASRQRRGCYHLIGLLLLGSAAMAPVAEGESPASIKGEERRNCVNPEPDPPPPPPFMPDLLSAPGGAATDRPTVTTILLLKMIFTPVLRLVTAPGDVTGDPPECEPPDPT